MGASPSLSLTCQRLLVQPSLRKKSNMKVGEVHLLAPKFDEVTYLVSHSARSKLTTSSEKITVKQSAICRHKDHAYPTPNRKCMDVEAWIGRGANEEVTPYLSADKVKKRERYRYDLWHLIRNCHNYVPCVRSSHSWSWSFRDANVVSCTVHTCRARPLPPSPVI